jgi:hypothetical protein
MLSQLMQASRSQDIASAPGRVSASVLGIFPQDADDSMGTRTTDSQSYLRSSADTDEQHIRRRLIAERDDYWATFGDDPDRSRYRRFKLADPSDDASEFNSDIDDEPTKRVAKAFVS